MFRSYPRRVRRNASVEIVFLIGAVEYPMPAEEARRLEDVIRRACVDEYGLPRDENARACLQLADVIREDLKRGGHPEPIELGRSHVEGLCQYVVEAEEIVAVAELTDLCAALKRYRGS
jgi:hypothetical protein